MAKVLSLKESNFQGSDGSMVTCWKVELDNKTNPVPCYSGLAGDLKVGDPLPEGWEIKVSKAGKDYLAVPKAPKGGGGFNAAWRNTEAGERFNAQQMNRRTALMQAVALTNDLTVWRLIADQMYAWLMDGGSPSTPAPGGTTKDPNGANSGGGAESDPPTPPPVSPEGPVPGKVTGVAPEAEGGGSDEGNLGAGPSPEAVHLHTWKDAPRKGWSVCTECGLAEMTKRIKT